jgi:muramoyltetrapeptide carboxypeptidase
MSGGAVRVSVIAPSSPVPMVELAAGVEILQREGFTVRVHDQCARQHFTFAGTDRERVNALAALAYAPDIDVSWCARGGYGATRLLPLLDDITRNRGVPPRKLLVGYSDVTALHEYVRTHWGWATLHADMPASTTFGHFDRVQWEATLGFVRGQSPQTPWPTPLEFLTDPPGDPIDAPIIGGTLTLFACLAGTPYAPDTHGRILFFEDVGERWYRIDRMVTQLRQSGAFDGARAIILGDFKDCEDDVHRVRRDATSNDQVPLRPFYPPDHAIREIFGTLNLPVARGVPVGHGPNFAPLPLGATYRLSPDGHLSLLHWNWLRSPAPRAIAE